MTALIVRWNIVLVVRFRLKGGKCSRFSGACGEGLQYRFSAHRGSQGNARSQQGKAAPDCWYCRKKGHTESECWKKRADLNKAGSSRGYADRCQRSHYAEGSRRVGTGPAFVMEHKANSMAMNTLRLNEVWYMDSGASNHITNHQKWFSNLEKSEQLGVVETSDDTSHPIEPVGDVPLRHVDYKGRLRTILHVPTVTKNLVLVG